MINSDIRDLSDYKDKAVMNRAGSEKYYTMP